MNDVDLLRMQAASSNIMEYYAKIDVFKSQCDILEQNFKKQYGITALAYAIKTNDECLIKLHEILKNKSGATPMECE